MGDLQNRLVDSLQLAPTDRSTGKFSFLDLSYFLAAAEI